MRILRVDSWLFGWSLRGLAPSKGPKVTTTQNKTECVKEERVCRNECEGTPKRVSSSRRTTSSHSFSSTRELSRGSKGGLQRVDDSWSEFLPQSLVSQNRDPFARRSIECEEDPPECEECEEPPSRVLCRGSRRRAISDCPRTLKSLGVENKVVDFQQSSLFAVPVQKSSRSFSTPARIVG
eukprot:CAMPEP_0118937120 /NCGR_PEP_ID=MMETSP1169-20130426/21687_1 /TAXON_ID=36882 /ORGANISM="Pyramimonas obovata, Strain CCMP722" /LENGTH=180 /DNA_ID=CAMNT_0006880657 /DNA_START=43 /DNA_END=585 /DNA_ORIENTATION=+